MTIFRESILGNASLGKAVLLHRPHAQCREGAGGSAPHPFSVQVSKEDFAHLRGGGGEMSQDSFLQAIFKQNILYPREVSVFLFLKHLFRFVGELLSLNFCEKISGYYEPIFHLGVNRDCTSHRLCGKGEIKKN